jgi:hypothetical protein
MVFYWGNADEGPLSVFMTENRNDVPRGTLECKSLCDRGLRAKWLQHSPISAAAKPSFFLPFIIILWYINQVLDQRYRRVLEAWAG